MSQPGDKFTKETTAQEVVDTFADKIKGRYIVVTGTTPGGLGAETARAIATKEPKLLVLASRDQAKMDETRDAILKETPGANIKTVILDLDSLEAVRKAAAEIAALGDVDVLINNAAVMMCPYSKTVDGFEKQFGVNYLGPWLLTNLLIPSLLKTPHPRVVFVASAGHMYSGIRFDDIGFQDGKVYDKQQAYGQSKTANMLNAVALAEKYGKNGLVAISLHPGGILTNLARHLNDEDMERLVTIGFLNPDRTPNMAMAKTLEQGASTTLTAAFDPRMDKINGWHLYDNQPAKIGASDGRLTQLHNYAVDKEAAKRLWDLSNKLVGENF